MCCLAYEQPNYEALWDKLPPPMTKIKALNSEECYIVESINLGDETVNVRFPSGRLVAVAISEFENFNAVITSGEEWGEEEPVKKVKAVQPAFTERKKPRGSLAAADSNNNQAEGNIKNKKFSKSKLKKNVNAGEASSVKHSKFKKHSSSKNNNSNNKRKV